MVAMIIVEDCKIKVSLPTEILPTARKTSFDTRASAELTFPPNTPRLMRILY